MNVLYLRCFIQQLTDLLGNLGIPKGQCGNFYGRDLLGILRIPKGQCGNFYGRDLLGILGIPKGQCGNFYGKIHNGPVLFVFGLNVRYLLTLLSECIHANGPKRARCDSSFVSSLTNFNNNYWRLSRVMVFYESCVDLCEAIPLGVYLRSLWFRRCISNNLLIINEFPMAIPLIILDEIQEEARINVKLKHMGQGSFSTNLIWSPSFLLHFVDRLEELFLLLDPKKAEDLSS
ncbi:hypothetical protein VNO77_27543 [Canavalia gladiata]|uniref:Uncharacterized protein n=1 Tax=Canavalia gladiata TaxID=3824 RepID=A0AAN9QAL4_CANGL